MSKTITTTTAVAILAFAVTGTAQARGGHGIGGRHLLLGPPPVGVPQPGNALNQLSPLPFGVDRPDALGIR